MNSNVVVHEILRTTGETTQVETSLVRGKGEIVIEIHISVKEKQEGSKTEIGTIIGNEIQVYHHRKDEEGEDCGMMNIMMLMGINLTAVTAASPKG